jgi:hypothetical protein
MDIDWSAGEDRSRTVQVQDKSSLYDRLGGVYNVATVVDDFIDRTMVEPGERESRGRRGASSRYARGLQVPRH